MLLALPCQFLYHLNRAILHCRLKLPSLNQIIDYAAEIIVNLLLTLLHLLWKLLLTLLQGLKTLWILNRKAWCLGFDWVAAKTADLLIILFKCLWWLGRQIKKRVVDFVLFFTYLNWQTFHSLGVRTVQQRLYGLSAEMAYHSTLALVPALLALLAAIGSNESLQSTLLEMANLLGEVVPEQVQKLIGATMSQSGRSLSPRLFSFSFIISIWLFSGVISSAMEALNRIHQVPQEKIRPFWKSKLIAIALTLGTLLLLIMALGAVFISDFLVEIIARKSCILETVGNCPLDKIDMCLAQEPVQDCLLQSTLLDTWNRLQWPITLGIVSTNFAFIYRYGPSYRKPKTPLIPGSILAAIFWALISNLFRWYVYQSEYYNLIYGAIGTFIVLLLWLNISSLVVLMGAQLNATVGDEIRRRKTQKDSR
ncbi:YihY/virulence factor BrkB family protein [Arthrospira platensis]|uniref:YihY/virulence factor BrkB family protein n=1 Tax=Limnospira TaxID=2596745 RepID=UPI000B01C477|nr:YihY/virulence factor BrkB family protein [Arthrospira platensis]MBD2669951.1 YihY/virulence factor BrkB family protein [Arthrospira platensis FACHB-439]MBD2710530.1 YihY/virulence factor BrkB family protein [Arthrospira platensis FACHB-835]MDT9181940.1 YihY/virulence factor BrkB family protein [Limnospira sp. PMC 289.06]MDT9295257.1 YihY/virulence factor BrkB family protein [Arthrospira platensis PCC 7345]QQW29816.1 YihY/virulence factor BrkB family protein [Arthrospira sp. PCC 9108]